MPTKGKSKADVKILTIEGRGWNETYEVKPNGDKVLINSYNNTGELYDIKDATAMTVTKYMPWSEFCRKHRNNSKYVS